MKKGNLQYPKTRFPSKDFKLYMTIYLDWQNGEYDSQNIKRKLQIWNLRLKKLTWCFTTPTPPHQSFFWLEEPNPWPWGQNMFSGCITWCAKRVITVTLGETFEKQFIILPVLHNLNIRKKKIDTLKFKCWSHCLN